MYCRHRVKLYLVCAGTLIAAALLAHQIQAADKAMQGPFSITLDNPYVIPLDVDRAALGKVGDDAQLPQAQRLFDIFAWRAFIALNWPARANGEPDPGGQFSDATTPKVWEYWRQSSEVFLPKGAPPKPWGRGGPSTAVLDHWKAGWRAHTTLDQGLQAFSGPLIDQRGYWVHYQALMNRREFDYLVDNQLYNLEGQAQFTQEHTIEFPVNDDQQPGAIEIKLAWKRLTPEDDESRYLVRRLPIIPYGVDKSEEQQKNGKALGSGSSQPVKVGLIGMHIAMRTRSSPQWIWATFEQVDNTRIDESTVPDGHAPMKPSLSDPDNPFALVRANLIPPKNGRKDPRTGEALDWMELLPGTPGAVEPVEVLRLVPPPPGTARVNREAQRLLVRSNSVLRYYELIGTQWPRHPKAPAVPGGQGSAPESIIRKTPGDVVPVYLINTTMETYFQKGFQDAGPLEQDDRVPFSIDTTKVFATESCVGCHYSAGACIGFRKDSLGQFLRDPSGRKIPIYGQNSNGGLTGSANYSWLLQIEAQSSDIRPPDRKSR